VERGGAQEGNASEKVFTPTCRGPLGCFGGINESVSGPHGDPQSHKQTWVRGGGSPARLVILNVGTISVSSGAHKEELQLNILGYPGRMGML